MRFVRIISILLCGILLGAAPSRVTIRDSTGSSAVTTFPAAGKAYDIFNNSVMQAIQGYIDDRAFWQSGNVEHIENYASLNAAVTAIGSATSTLLIPISTTVSSNVTIPVNITLLFIDQGQLSINAGVTVTIFDPERIHAPKRRQVFAGSGSVVFTNPGTVYPGWWGAMGDGIADDYIAINAMIIAVPAGSILYFPAAANYYRVTDTPTMTKVLHVIGEGFRIAAGALTGSVIRQEGGTTKDAWFVDGTAGELDGVLIENMAFGGTSSSRHALYFGPNINRSTFRNIFLAGAVESAFKVAAGGLNILNKYETIRISMGFTSGIGYAIPKRGFDLSSGTGPNVWVNCGVAGVTTAPGTAWDLSAGANGNFFIQPEAENNTIGWNFGSAGAGGNFFMWPYHEGNGTVVTGTPTSPTNLSIGSTLGTSTFLELGSAIGASIAAASNGSLAIRGSDLLARIILSPYTTPQGSLHASRTGVTAKFNADVEGGIPIFGHTDSNVDDVMIAQFVATGALADARLQIGANGSQNVGDIGMRAYRRSTGIQRNINIHKLGVDVIATASLPAAGASENGRIVIEDAAAGDRNLIIYAGGQRFRIDGGVAF